MTRRPLPPESTTESTPPDAADPMAAPAQQFNALALMLEQLNVGLADTELAAQEAMGQALQVQQAFLGDSAAFEAAHPADLEAAQLHVEACAMAVLAVARIRRFVAFWVDVPVMQPQAWDAHREVAMGTLQDFRP